MANVRAASAPSSRDIFGIPIPGGNPVGPGNMSMGIGGPNVPRVTWEPRGASGKGPASFLRYGVPPKSHGSISLKSVEFIPYQYMCPPLNDSADLLLMPEMPCFTVNELDPEEDSTVVLSLAKLNKLFQDQYNDFVNARDPGMNGTSAAPTNPLFSDDAFAFHQWLKEYGERGLDDYAYAESHNQQDRLRKMDAEAPDLKRFWQLATSSEFCWLTRYGILKRISFSGIIINTNRAIGLEAVDQTENHEHYVQVNVGIGKRVRCAQVFGMNDEITTGSKVWILLTRKQLADKSYGAFKLQPSGSKKLDYPLAHHMTYVDDAGMTCTGYHWKVGKCPNRWPPLPSYFRFPGVVIEPADKNPQPFSLEQANNTGLHISERVSYEAHGTLPSLYLAVGKMLNECCVVNKLFRRLQKLKMGVQNKIPPFL
jgi:hypothetical protein